MDEDPYAQFLTSPPTATAEPPDPYQQFLPKKDGSDPYAQFLDKASVSAAIAPQTDAALRDEKTGRLPLIQAEIDHQANLSPTEKGFNGALPADASISAPPTTSNDTLAFAKSSDERIGRFFSPLFGPTEQQKREESAPVKSADGETHYEYKPIGSMIDQIGLAPSIGEFVNKAVPGPSGEFLPRIPKQDSVALQVGASVVNAGEGMVEYLASPQGALSLVAGTTGPTAGKIVANAFRAQIASSLPAQVDAFKNAPTWQDKVDAGVATGLSALLLHGIGSHLKKTVSDENARDILRTAPTAIIQQAAGDADFRKTWQYDPKLLDEELKRRTTALSTSTADAIQTTAPATAEALREPPKVEAIPGETITIPTQANAQEAAKAPEPNAAISQSSGASEASRTAAAPDESRAPGLPAAPPVAAEAQGGGGVDTLPPKETPAGESVPTAPPAALPAEQIVIPPVAKIRFQTETQAEFTKDQNKRNGVIASGVVGEDPTPQRVAEVAKASEAQPVVRLEGQKGTHAEGTFVTVHKSTKPDGKFQITFFARSKEGSPFPFGDVAISSREGGIAHALRHQYEYEPRKAVSEASGKRPAPGEAGKPAGVPGGTQQVPGEVPGGKPAAALTDRDAKVAELFNQGKNAKAIAAELGISTRAADNSIQKLKKLPAAEPAAVAPAPTVKESLPVAQEAAKPEAPANASLASDLGKIEATETKGQARFAQQVEQGRKMGLTAPLPPSLRAGLDAVGRIAKEIVSLPKFTAFKETINKWVAAKQTTAISIRQIQAEINRIIPRQVRRDAVTNYIQADGDVATLKAWAASTKNRRLREGYESAQTLSVQEKAVADRVRKFYSDKLAEGKAKGVLQDGIENYVNQVWKRQFVGGGQAPPFAGKLARTFKFGKQRTFESFFEGEQAGFTPATKDIAKLVGSYLNEMDKVIATREMIKDLTERKASDGRPLAAPSGAASVVEGAEPSALMIRPSAKSEETSDYHSIPNPALSKWKWVHTDENGGTTMLLGDLALHPEIYGHMKAILGRSAISEWYDKPAPPLKSLVKGAVKALDVLQGVVKQTMLDISPFHYVQEGTHAIGHKINPIPLPRQAIEALRAKGMEKTADFFELPKLDPKEPIQADAMKHGLMMGGDHTAMENFVDGITGGAGSLLRKLPYVGDHIKAASEFLFNEYIPRLKFKTYQHILERNMKRLEGDIASGKASESDVKYLSAQQANAAYGHLNYADMGRSPFVSHLARAFLLAPDFLEARGRFTGQAFKPGAAGAEQRAAMLTLAIVFYGAARAINQALDNDPHWEEPFGVKHNGRLYTMRSVPEDIYRLFSDSRRFINGRLSPLLGSGTLEVLTGKNYRGEKVTWSETAVDLATRIIPISLRGTPGFREMSESNRNNTINGWEQFVSSFGLQISRNSAISETYRMAGKWKDSQGIKADTGTYPVSKYQQLRYALEDGNLDAAKEEYSKLLKESPADKIASGFHQSVNHPFTGSAETDKKFRASLTVKQAKLYKEAVTKRAEIMANFAKIGGAQKAKSSRKSSYNAGYE